MLIFDEVHVVSRLMWNSRNQKLVGFAMNHEDMSCLLDVYRIIEKDNKTRNTDQILQFLWRDLTSAFDVVGPYYTGSGSFESKHLVGIVLETMKVFHLFGFNTSVLVCDGASMNLTTIKATMGVSGVFSRNETASDVNAISPSFSNPFNPSRNIHWLICPSHQVHVLCL